MMRLTHRILITALAVSIAFAGIGYRNVGAEYGNAKHAEDQALLLNGETIIPEDFPNIFTSYEKKSNGEVTAFLSINYLKVLVNGRPFMLPVFKSSDQIIRNMIDGLKICTHYFEVNQFKPFNNVFNKDDQIYIQGLYEFEDILNNFDIDINDKKFLDYKEIIENDLSIKMSDFIELYKMIIPRGMLPIKLETPQINLNPTIPKYKKEFLNKPVDLENLGNLIIYKNHTDYPCQYEFLDFSRYDVEGAFYTTSKYYNVITQKFEIDMLNGMSQQKLVKSKGFNSSKYYFATGYGFEGVLLTIGEHFPAMIEPLLAVKTYGDLLEVYQMLPLEYQRQYKESDFKDNPYVDPAWRAERPYVELSVGSSGQEVLDMKQRFYELGYFRTSSFNDRFTDSTADTVRLFEKNNGLPVDGVADAVMLGVLFSDKAVGK